MSRQGGYNHDIKGQKRTVTGQYVYNNKPAPRQVMPQWWIDKQQAQVPAAEMTLWGK